MEQDSPFTMQICGHLYNPFMWTPYSFYLTNRIHYIISGTEYYQGKRKLIPGFVYIFPADPNFNVTQDSSDPVDHIYFDFLSYEKLLVDSFIEIDAAAIPGLKDLFNSAACLLTTRESQHRFGPLYFRLLMELLRSSMPVHQYHSPVTQAAIHSIHQSSPANLTVSGIAEKINVNEDHLIRCFHKDTGYTPHRYISLFKTDLATSMIRSGASIKETADALGFSSVASFSTFYKHERRVPPSTVKPM